MKTIIEKISFENYKEACFKFAEETKDWCNIDGKRHYKSVCNEWKETTDGSDSVLDVSWSFHKTPEEIEKLVKIMFNAEIEFEIYCFNEIINNDEEYYSDLINILKTKIVY